MCGIIGYVGKNNDAAQKILTGLQNLEYRGYDSWGLAMLASRAKRKEQSDKIYIEKHIGKIGNSSLNTKLLNLNSDIGVGHTRWATHGGVTKTNAHPHYDCSQKIVVVHNGIIENFIKLKHKLQAKNHVFYSDTDTEVISHLIEEYQDLGFDKACKKAFSNLIGRNAFVAVTSDSTTLVGIRNGSPLVFGIGNNEYYLASDIPAFLKHTKDVIFLDDNQGVVVRDNSYQVFDLAKKKKITPKIEKISWDITLAEKGDYPHYLLKEILEQPKTIHAAVQQSNIKINKLAKIIQNAFGSYLVACGTASYAALYGTYVFSSIAKKHINWAIGSEFSDYQHFLTPKTLVIAVSQSGETADTLEAIQIAKQKKAKTVAIVNVMGSSLMRTANYCLMTNSGPEIAVVSTKAFTAQLSLLLLLAYATVNKFKEGKQLIEKTAKEIDKMLTENFCQNIRQLAKKLENSQHIYVIGKGQNYPIALEAALKIKEASYIHGEGFAAGELKHGVIALIEKGTPCIVLFGNDQDKNYILSSAMEMKTRGGYIIGIGPGDNEVFDEFLKVPGIAQASAIVNTPLIQLLAYYLSIERKLDPDKPRNLAKSVTVK